MRYSIAATDLPDLEDVKMNREDPSSQIDDVVSITWTDGCQVQVFATETENVAVRL